MSAWINVDDGLPEEGVDVLVTQHEYADKTKKRYFDVCCYLDGGWIDSANDEEVYEPTHWMPLPRPPEDM